MFVSMHNVVELKGCVACEIHSHEVLLTELLFTNMFGEFEPAEIAALLSCIIFQQVYPQRYQLHNYACGLPYSTLVAYRVKVHCAHFCRIDAVNQNSPKI